MNDTQAAILDAAARYYGSHIAQGGLSALLQVAPQLIAIVQALQIKQESHPPAQAVNEPTSAQTKDL